MTKSVLIVDSDIQLAIEVEEIGRQAGFLVHIVDGVSEANNIQNTLAGHNIRQTMATRKPMVMKAFMPIIA